MSNENHIQTIEPAPRALATVPATPADILLYAIEKGGDIEQIEKLMNLQMRWEADQARKAFVADMAEFKKNPPTIVKDKLVGYENRDGSFTGYKHATLGNVTNAIVEGLAAHGFSHRWDVKQDGAFVHVTCTITHRMGHSEAVSMQAGKDDSGKKNAIQQVASAITYLQRYTLLAATGLATHDQGDDDGRTAELDTTLADKWIAKAKAAPSASALEKVWQDGADEITEANDLHAFRELKDAVNVRKAEIGGTAARPDGAKSRMAGIVDQAKQKQQHQQAAE